MTARTPGRPAYRDVPAAFSRWCRTDDVSVSDMAILTMWRSTTAAKRAFWTEDGAVTAAAAAPGAIEFEDHRWYTVLRQNGKFIRAFAGGREFSGLGVFDTEEEYENWRNA